MAVHCPACRWTFGSQAEMQRHLASHHGTDEVPPKPAEARTASSQEHPPAGWYSNPSGDGTRYWDGTRWTEHTSASEEGTDPPGWYTNPSGRGKRYWDGNRWTGSTQGARSAPTDFRLVLSYLAAFLFPIGGLIAGILLLARRSTAHGVAVLLISVVMGTVALLLIPNDSSSDRGGHLISHAAQEKMDACTRRASQLSAHQLIACMNRAARVH
jgi:Protein of unknown function (DUF2510)